MALAYLYTGDEAYARKAVELFLLHAREFRELPWTIQSETPWSRGDFILGASRIAWSSTYGSNWYYKNHCRLLSAISGAAAWTPEVADRVYRGFAIPYAMELMKFRGGLSNMTDLTWNVPPPTREQHEAAGTSPEPVRLAFWQAPLAGREVYTAKTGINNTDTTRMPDAAPSLICRVRGKTAAWVTVLEPYREAPRVAAVEPLGAFGATVRLADGTVFAAAWEDLVKEP